MIFDVIFFILILPIVIFGIVLWGKFLISFFGSKPPPLFSPNLGQRWREAVDNDTLGRWRTSETEYDLLLERRIQIWISEVDIQKIHWQKEGF